MRPTVPDLVISQTEEPPMNHWCSSGHTAPEFFRRLGPGTEPEPTRFYHLKSNDIDTVVCEPCLIIANHVAKIKRQQLKKL